MSLQDLAHGIIREYLKLHNYTAAYEAFEAEAERRGIEKAFHKRVELLDAAGLTAPMREETRKRKEGGDGLLTSLEVLLREYLRLSEKPSEPIAQVEVTAPSDTPSSPPGTRRRRRKVSRRPEEKTEPTSPIERELDLLRKSSLAETWVKKVTVSLQDFIEGRGGMDMFRTIMFGGRSSKDLPDSWYQSLYCMAFYPSRRRKATGWGLEEPTTWGIHQGEGGPCGPIAILQGRAVRFMFQGEPPLVEVSPFADALISTINPDNTLRTYVLGIMSAIYETFMVLLRTGAPCFYIVLPATYSELTHDALTDVLRTDAPLQELVMRIGADMLIKNMDRFVVLCIETEADLRTFCSSGFYQAYALFMRASSFIPSLVVSLVLTRSLAQIQTEDFGDDTHTGLLNTYNNASQELINIFLQGRATGHLHDRDLDLDGMVLRGIYSPTDLGFLSIFEHYGYIVIGANAKWHAESANYIVLNEDHYTLLFAKDMETNKQIRTLLSQRNVPTRTQVDFIYYDSLDSQPDLIRLTLTLEGPITCKVESDGIHKESFVDNLLFSLFGEALQEVDWNGTEPYL